MSGPAQKLYRKAPYEEFPVGCQSEFEINEDDLVGKCDVLDLQRMVDKFSEKSKPESRVSEIIPGHLQLSGERHKNRYRPMTDREYEEMKQTDRLLKKVYRTYHHPGLKEFPEIKRQYKKMIQRLKQKPHMYSPYERDESTDNHVQRWLFSSTGKAEPEFVGFTSLCPLEPKRMVPSYEPRVCNSDINIPVTGQKRKMCDVESDDVISAVRSSSDTRLVREESPKAQAVRKRRKC